MLPVLLAPLPNRLHPPEPLPHPPALPGGVDTERGICGRSLVFAPPSFILLLLPRRGSIHDIKIRLGLAFSFAAPHSPPPRVPTSLVKIIPTAWAENIPQQAASTPSSGPLGVHVFALAHAPGPGELRVKVTPCTDVDVDVARESFPLPNRDPDPDINLCASLSLALTFFIVGALASREVDAGSGEDAGHKEAPYPHKVPREMGDSTNALSTGDTRGDSDSCTCHCPYPPWPWPCARRTRRLPAPPFFLRVTENVGANVGVAGLWVLVSLSSLHPPLLVLDAYSSAYGQKRSASGTPSIASPKVRTRCERGLGGKEVRPALANIEAVGESPLQNWDSLQTRRSTDAADQPARDATANPS
ncbi:hypothetical protein B0H13DRAFT_2362475 [Mycena leptocephala]|nr:hypothetical protein B0H13DRAFT_2362475 [Mycena leptocephala]